MRILTEDFESDDEDDLAHGVFECFDKPMVIEDQRYERK